MSPESLVPQSISASAVRRGRLPFGFAPRFLLILLVGLLWLIPSWWSPRFIAGMFLWDAFFLVAWLVDLLRLPKPAQLEVRREWTAPLSLGRPAITRIGLQNSSATDLHALLLDEASHVFHDEPVALEASVAAGQRVIVDYSSVPRRRGDVPVGRVFFRYRSTLALAERWAVADLRQTVRILPDLQQARDNALYLIRSRQAEMEKRRRRQRGMGREFQALREYRQGDEWRNISWSATARRHQLITRTFQVERSQHVWIILDAGRLMRARVQDESRGLAVSKLDYAVDAALSLAQVAIQSGDRVGLIAYGRHVQQSVALGRGPQHIRALLDSLAQVQGEAPEADHARAAQALLKAQSRRALIVWITDFAETATTPEVIEQVLRMTSRHLVVFAALTQPDLIALTGKIPASVDEMFQHTAAIEIAHRRESLLRRLRDRGVLAVDLVPGKLTTSIIDRYLEVKDRNLL